MHIKFWEQPFLWTLVKATFYHFVLVHFNCFEIVTPRIPSQQGYLEDSSPELKWLKLRNVFLENESAFQYILVVDGLPFYDNLSSSSNLTPYKFLLQITLFVYKDSMFFWMLLLTLFSSLAYKPFQAGAYDHLFLVKDTGRANAMITFR